MIAGLPAGTTCGEGIPTMKAPREGPEQAKQATFLVAPRTRSPSVDLSSTSARFGIWLLIARPIMYTDRYVVPRGSNASDRVAKYHARQCMSKEGFERERESLVAEEPETEMGRA